VILNGTSAKLGYTVPFTLVKTGKYRTEDKLKIQTIHKHNPEKANNATHSKKNYSGLVVSYNSARKCWLVGWLVG